MPSLWNINIHLFFSCLYVWEVWKGDISMDKVTASGSDSSPGTGRTTYHKDIITLNINSISFKLSKGNVTGESEQNLNIAMSPFTHHYHNFSPLVPSFLIILVLYWSRCYTQNLAFLKKCIQKWKNEHFRCKTIEITMKWSFLLSFCKTLQQFFMCTAL